MNTFVSATLQSCVRSKIGQIEGLANAGQGELYKMEHIEIIIDPNVMIKTPSQLPVETAEQALRDVLLKFSAIECYDNKKHFSYEEIKGVISSKIRQLEQRRKNND